MSSLPRVRDSPSEIDDDDTTFLNLFRRHNRTFFNSLLNSVFASVANALAAWFAMLAGK